VGRTATWLTEIETRKLSLSLETEKTFLMAIGRLERFDRTVEEEKAKLTADLKLPPTRIGPSREQ